QELIYQNIVSLFVMDHAVQRNSRVFSGLLASLRHLCRQSVESSSFQNLFRPGACREAPSLFRFL
ncbi:hypothetical protein Q6244_28110, partial [Klebsiella pneumoniae]|uniref:hypothetical protein n=1 Tax=Klebsiella pneumoniae TaxID=573 RepID=UPI00272F1F26